MKHKPYKLLLWIGVLILLISNLVPNSADAYEIRTHDTYFLISRTQILWVLTFVALFIWQLYVLTHRYLYSQKLTWIHVVITLITILFFLMALLLNKNWLNQALVQHMDIRKITSFNGDSVFTIVIDLLLKAMILGQCVFVFNLGLGVKNRMSKG